MKVCLYRNALLCMIALMLLAATSNGVAHAQAAEAASLDAVLNMSVNQWVFTSGIASPGVDLGEQLELVVANSSGKAVPSGYTIQLYVSPDPVITAADTQLDDGKIAGPAIPAANTAIVTVPAQARIPAGYPAGMAYLGVVVDTENQVNESTEADNRAVLAIVILDPSAPFGWSVTTAQDNLDIGTFRHALTYARSGDTIKFDSNQFFAGAQAGLVLAEPLPALTQGDLRIVSAASSVFIDGLLLPDGSAGWVIASDNNHLSGISLRNMPGDAITISGNQNRFDGDLESAQSAAIASTVAGPTNPAISMVAANSGNGIVIAGDNNVIDSIYVIANGANGIILLDGAADNMIGSTTPGRGNLIGGNQLAGVRIEGSGAQGNQLLGNYIGANFDGFNAFGNQANGIVIAQGATNNHVGGAGVGEGNLISGNSGAGVLIEESDANHLRGNRIGTRADGLSPLPNSNGGIRLVSAAGNHIGGASPAGCKDECNLVSGNNGGGILITGAGSSGNLVYGNSVGLNVDWSGALANGGNGIEIRNFAHENQIGGQNAGEGNNGEGNNVAGNIGHGLYVADIGVQNNVIQGNRIGDNYGAGLLLGNGGYGIAIGPNASLNEIGGSINQANAIRYNILGGVLFANSDGALLLHNSIQFNGNNPAGDPGSGVVMLIGTNDTLVEENNISLNFGHGVAVLGATRNEIALNSVADNGAQGLLLREATETTVLTNSVSGNDGNGIVLEDARNNTVRENNVKSNGNLPFDDATGQGIVLDDHSEQNIVALNRIEQNLGDGVRIVNGSAHNSIGNNHLELNQNHGIHVAASNNNTLSQNEINDNDVDGIFLSDVDTCLVTGNEVTFNGNNGIELAQTRNCVITTNVARDNGDEVTNASATQEGTIFQNGIVIRAASHHNQVLGNAISFNLGSGIRVTDDRTEENTVTGNEIQHNALYGLLFIAGARDNTAADNTILYNKEDGVGVLGLNTLRNLLTENFIYQNGGLAIENEAGGNTELAPPLVTAYTEYMPATWAITGTTCAGCVVEVFSDGSTEGEFFEGSVTAGGGGDFTISAISRTGLYFALTARLPDGNTSELSVINDMSISDIEVTQVVQSIDAAPNWDNRMRQHAGKPTVARVYVNSTVGVMPGITAYLYGQLDGVDLGGITPNHGQCPATLSVIPAPDRAELDESFCFVLPESWIAGGDLNLIAHINPTNQAPELNYTNNTFEVINPIAFVGAGAAPSLRFFRIAHRQSLVPGITLDRDFHDHDGIDVGDIDGDGQNDLVVASRESDHLLIYSAVSLTVLSNAKITVTLDTAGAEYDNGYQLAVGNVDDDPQIEMVVGSDQVGDDPDVRVWEWDGVNTVLQGGFDGNFTINDELAIGNLIPDDSGRNEIAVAGDGTGRIDIFRWNGSTWALVDDFNSTYDIDNTFAVGDVVDGDGVDEVLIGRNAFDEIDVYRWNGADWSLFATFDAKIKGISRLVAADVDGEPFNGNMLEEIIVGNPKIECRCLDVYGLTDSGFRLASRSDGFNFDKEKRPFRRGDVLAAGDIDLDGKAEVIVGQVGRGIAQVFTKRVTGPWDIVATDEIHVRYLRSFLLRAYPIVDMTVLGALDGVDLLLDNEAGTPDSDELNALLKKMQRQANENWSDSLVLYYAMVTDQDGFMRGSSKGKKDPASGPTGDPAGTGNAWDKDGSFGDWYGAHEIAHSLDIDHAPYCTAEGKAEDYQESYVYNDAGDPDINEAFIGGPPENRRRFFGFDTGDASLTMTDGSIGYAMDVYPGDVWTDFMSYCDNQWISDYNYNVLYEKLNDFFAAAVQPAAAGEYLALDGTLDLSADGGAGEGVVYSVYTLVNPTELSPIDADSALVLHLLNLNGGTIASYGLPLQPDSDPEPGGAELASFDATVPYPPDLVMLRLTYGSTEIFSRTVSLNRPTVTILSPNGGETLNGDVVVEWKGQDADGDELRYSLLYSADGGATYQPLVANWSQSRFELSTTQLRGSERGRFKVLVDDGVYTGSDESDAAFTVTANPLRAEILNPANNALFVRGQNVLLVGRAGVPNGESADGILYEWSSDRNGALGSGKSLQLADLAVGLHTLTLRVSANNLPAGESTVQIQVRDHYDNGSLPVASDDLSATVEDTAVDIQVLANDGDPNDDALTVVAVGAAAHGTAVIVGGSTVRYTPAPDFVGTDIFTYTISDAMGSDAMGGTATATVMVEVANVNDPPVAVDDEVVMAGGSTANIFVVANDVDADEDLLEVVAVQEPAHGSVQLAGAVLLYRPDAGFVGIDTFEYTVRDGPVSDDPVTDDPVSEDRAVVTVYVSGYTLTAPGMKTFLPNVNHSARAAPESEPTTTNRVELFLSFVTSN